MKWDTVNDHLDPTAMTTFERITLQRERVAVEQRVTRQIIELGRWKDIQSHIDDSLVRRLMYELLTHTDTFMCPKYPSNWWQAVRERWAPTWWLKRYPVVYTTPVATVRAKYPTIYFDNADHRAYVDVILKQYTNSLNAHPTTPYTLLARARETILT